MQRSDHPSASEPTGHVFISYSRADKPLVDRLVEALRQQGIMFWLDQRDLVPGTPDWEQAIRDAIRNADAVLLIASENSRRSPYVRDELTMVEAYKGRGWGMMIPVWIEGDTWIDSIPMGWGGTQNVDARGQNFDTALQELMRRLQTIGASRDESTTSLPIPRKEMVNPYKGLEAFQPDDQRYFFGREALVEELLEKFDQISTPSPEPERLLAVIGASGSGKSSVVMAGLLPALKDNKLPGSSGYDYLPRMVPGRYPIQALAEIIGKQYGWSTETVIRRMSDSFGLDDLVMTIGTPQKRVVLFIDQFEELFVQTIDERDRRLFLDMLTHAVKNPNGKLIVILTMRADFYDRPLKYEELGKLMDANSKSVLPMSLPELRSVIVKPAEIAGAKFEEALVGDLLLDIRNEPGALPLLQFTLQQLFDNRKGHKLTREAYETLGGVKGALAQWAEHIFDELPSDEHRGVAQQLFLRLIDPGNDAQDTTRRRMTAHDMDTGDAAHDAMFLQVRQAFVNARLLVTNTYLNERGEEQAMLEVAHEALIREWDRLAQWVNAARETVRFQNRLAFDAAEWDRAGRPVEDRIYRGTRLNEAVDWLERGDVRPSQLERLFVQASVAYKEEMDRREAERIKTLEETLLRAEQATAEARDSEGRAERSQQVAKTVRRVSIIAGMIALLLIAGAVIAAISALGQVDDAQQQVAAADIFIATAQTQVAVVGETLTPAQLTLIAGQEAILTAVVAQGDALNSASTAQTRVAAAELTLVSIPLTLTPVPLTLTPVGQTLEAAQRQIAGVQPTLNAAETQIAGVQPTLDAAETQIAGVEPTVDAANTQVAGVQPTLDAADLAIGEAREQVAQSGATLTPIGATLAAAETQVAGVAPTLNAAETQVAGVAPTVNAAQTEVAAIEPTLLAADTAIYEARTQVAVSGLTLTPVPQTLTPIGETLEAAQQQIAGVQPTLDAAQTEVAGVVPTLLAADTAIYEARTQVAVSGLTLTPVPQTLTPIAATLEAAQRQIAGVQPTLNAAETEVAGVVPTLQAASTRVAGVEPTLAAANTQIAGADPTLTSVAGQIQQQSAIADAFRLGVAGEQLVSAGSPDLAMALILEAYKLSTSLPQTQRVLNVAVPLATRLKMTGNRAGAGTFTRDGKYYLEPNGTQIYLWDVAQRVVVRRFNGANGVTHIITSPDGQYIAGGGSNVSVWDMRFEEPEYVISSAMSGKALAFSPSNPHLIVGSGRVARVYDYQTRSLIKTMREHESSVAYVTFNANGQQAYAVDFDRRNPVVNIYNLSDNTEFTQRPSGFWGINPSTDEINPGNLYMVRGGDGAGFLQLWNPVNLVQLREFRLHNATNDHIDQISFSEDFTKLLVHVETRAYRDQAQTDYEVIGRHVALWNVVDGSELLQLQDGQESARNWTVTATALSPDGRYGLTAGRFGTINTVTLWDMSSGRELRRWTGHSSDITRVAFSPDGLYAVSISTDATRLWDVGQGDSDAFARLDPRVTTAGKMGFSADGTEIYLAFNDTSLATWITETGEQKNESRIFTGAHEHIAYSPTQPLAVVTTTDGTVLWDMTTAQRVYRMEAFDRGVNALSFSPDGQFIAIAQSGQAFLWDVENSTTNAPIRITGQSSLKMNGTNEFLLASGGQSTALFDLIEQVELRRFEGFNGEVTSSDLSLDGRYVVAGITEPDNAVMLWDAGSGRLLYSMLGHTASVRTVAFAPNGRTILSGSDDGTVILWDVSTGQSIRVYRGHTAPIVDVVYSPDGRTAVSRSANIEDNLIFWRIETVGDTVAWVYANRQIVELTCDQRAQYGVNPQCIDGVAPTATATYTPMATPTLTPTSTPRPTFTPSNTPLPTGVIIGQGQVNVRSGAGAGFSLVTRASAGITVQILETRDDIGWLRIRLPDNQVGWISADLVRRR